jgi:hypothetical protein
MKEQHMYAHAPHPDGEYECLVKYQVGSHEMKINYFHFATVC